jgi:BMFP domain-containing protein YqiC
VSPVEPTNLADLLERVLDKGIVIAGDIALSLGDIELLTLKIRLLIASVDKAQQIGIDSWKSDPALSSQARNQQLEEHIERLEARLGEESEHEAVEEDRDLLEQRLERLESRLGTQAQEEQQSGDRS